MHKLAVAATGGAGGFFGLSGLAMELPVSTTLMLRSIADIARSEGEFVTTTDTKPACIEVFALGGPTSGDDGSETGYYAIRGVLARAVADAAEFITQKGVIDKGAPVIVRLISAVASRFGTQVSEKVAAQAVPVIGAAGGALINTLFINHFQDMARGHFIVRRLERSYGADTVRIHFPNIILALKTDLFLKKRLQHDGSCATLLKLLDILHDARHSGTSDNNRVLQ